MNIFDVIAWPILMIPIFGIILIIVIFLMVGGLIALTVILIVRAVNRKKEEKAMQIRKDN